eukprot:jgi/Mesvir1/17208/Mv07625-RA.1
MAGVVGYGREPQTAESLGLFNLLSDELIVKILHGLTMDDIMRLACTSRVMYILCSEEPLWMQLCLEEIPVGRDLQYRESWRHTGFQILADTKGKTPPVKRVDAVTISNAGFSSLFLYRRWYRCHMAIHEFLPPVEQVLRASVTDADEFEARFDRPAVPAILLGLLDEWPARNSRPWDLPSLVARYGDARFKVSAVSGRRLTMPLREYAAYMAAQSDEEPLYIFDSKFGRAAPGLLTEYSIPRVFREDLLAVLPPASRPSFRWLVLGPPRSGASWHVDPSLTSAWNALLVGAKRWALYPPGRTPPGVFLRVDEDGDLDTVSPTSLQWFLEIYPYLKEEDKPIEVVQRPGETIFVPCGWWHCVLNLTDTVAVTQNFVSVANMRAVALDIASGGREGHAARLLQMAAHVDNGGGNPGDLVAEQEGQGCGSPENDLGGQGGHLHDRGMPVKANGDSSDGGHLGQEGEPWSHGNQKAAPGTGTSKPHVGKTETGEEVAHPANGMDVTKQTPTLSQDWASRPAAGAGAATGYSDVAQRAGASNEYFRLREWMRALWLARPDLQDHVWECADLCYDVSTWERRVQQVCKRHGLPMPAGAERLPCGGGSSMVFIVAGNAIKFFTTGSPARAAQVCARERAFCEAVRDHGPSSLADVTPQYLFHGAIQDDDLGEGGATPAISKHGISHRRFAALQYVVISEAKGLPLKDFPPDASGMSTAPRNPATGRKVCRDDFVAVARSLGAIIACIHSLPLPAQGSPEAACLSWDVALGESTSGKPSTWEDWTTGSECKVGENKSGSVGQAEISGHEDDKAMAVGDGEDGTVEEDPTTAKRQRTNGGEHAQERSTLQGNGLGSAIGNPADVNPGTLCAKGVPSRLASYAAFLAKQRRTLVKKLTEWDALPDHLLELVEKYVPAEGDIESLLPKEGDQGGCVWLHADVTDENVLVTGGAPAVDVTHSADQEIPSTSWWRCTSQPSAAPRACWRHSCRPTTATDTVGTAACRQQRWHKPARP